MCLKQGQVHTLGMHPANLPFLCNLSHPTQLALVLCSPVCCQSASPFHQPCTYYDNSTCELYSRHKNCGIFFLLRWFMDDELGYDACILLTKERPSIRRVHHGNALYISTVARATDCTNHVVITCAKKNVDSCRSDFTAQAQPHCDCVIFQVNEWGKTYFLLVA